MPQEIETEENLFESLENQSFEEEDDDDFANLEGNISLLSEDDEEDEDEDDEEDEERNIFNEDGEDDEDEEDEEEEDDDDEDELTEKDLAAFNKKLGTDFKSVEDLKKSFNKEEAESEQKKEEVLYDSLKEKVFLFDKYIEMDNEDLVRSQLMSEARSQKKDINDPDVIESIEDKIEGLKDLEQLDSMAETLRANLIGQKERAVGSINQIDQKREAAEQQIAQKNREELEVALSNIFLEKTFLGAEVKKEDILEVYKEIKSGKFHQKVNNNQEMIAQFAMFVKFKDVISKATKSPTHSDKIKGAFNALVEDKKTNSRSVANAKSTASSGNALDNLSAFIK